MKFHFCLQFQEVLEVKSATSTLHITLKGEGVSPVVNLSIENNELDMGAIIAGEYREDHFKVSLPYSLTDQLIDWLFEWLVELGERHGQGDSGQSLIEVDCVISWADVWLPGLFDSLIQLIAKFVNVGSLQG